MVWRALLTVLTVAALAVTAGPAAAADRPFYSADKLARLCRSEAQADQARCRGYIVGAADAMHGGHAVCLPAALTTAELVRLVRRQIARSDAEAGRRAETEIHKALTDAFPAPPCM